MKIHEYQAKELLRKYGVVTPRGIPCFSVEEAVKAAEELGGSIWVVKAQIHAGGRGKGGGVKLAKSPAEAKKAVAIWIVGTIVVETIVIAIAVYASAYNTEHRNNFV